MSEGEQASAPSTDYILVALDTSPYSAAALAAAAEVAATLNLELRGIYVEDVNLLHLCGLPFGLEIGSFTANPRRLEQARLERDFRLQAARLRRTMADIAGRQRVSWSFKVVRGGVTQEVLSAGSSAQMVSIGRVGTTPGKRTGSTAQAVVRNTQRPVIVQAQQ
ncbi:MAG: universal stress protein, partial [Caldilinea sp.]